MSYEAALARLQRRDSFEERRKPPSATAPRRLYQHHVGAQICEDACRETHRLVAEIQDAQAGEGSRHETGKGIASEPVNATRPSQTTSRSSSIPASEAADTVAVGSTWLPARTWDTHRRSKQAP